MRYYQFETFWNKRRFENVILHFVTWSVCPIFCPLNFFYLTYLAYRLASLFTYSTVHLCNILHIFTCFTKTILHFLDTISYSLYNIPVVSIFLSISISIFTPLILCHTSLDTWVTVSRRVQYSIWKWNLKFVWFLTNNVWLYVLAKLAQKIQQHGGTSVVIKHYNLLIRQKDVI